MWDRRKLGLHEEDEAQLAAGGDVPLYGGPVQRRPSLRLLPGPGSQPGVHLVVDSGRLPAVKTGQHGQGHRDECHLLHTDRASRHHTACLPAKLT